MAIQKISGVTIDLVNQESGDVTYFDGIDWVRLAKGEVGQILTMNESASAPIWGDRSAYYGGRGVIAGFGAGNFADDDLIEYVTISTLGNTQDFGNLSLGRTGFGSCSNGVRGVFGGNGPHGSETIDYITIGTLGDANDFGDLTSARGTASGGYISATSDETRGVFGGGGNSNAIVNIIDYITIDTPGNAIDFGDLTITRYGTGCSTNGTRGVWFGGGTGVGAGSPYYSVNTIDYVTISTIGNAIDFGDLVTVKGHTDATFSAAGRAVTGGHFTLGASIDYFQIDTLGNAIDFGDLTQGRYMSAAFSNGSRGCWGGGVWSVGPASGNTFPDNIDYITIATTGNALDFGDISRANGVAGLSGD